VPESPAAAPSPAGEAAGLSITWIGHATALVELDGVRILTDPVLRDRIAHLARLLSSPLPAAVGPLDAVLLSHLHADHADLPTLRALDLRGPIFAPAAACGWLTARGVGPAIALTPGEEAELGHRVTAAALRIRATPAIHDGRRRPYGPDAGALGFLVTGTQSVYFAGDTDLHPAMAELRGSVDVALLPVWGWGRRLGPGHLDPARAASAVAIILPRVAIPIHWGTFAVRNPLRRAADPAGPAEQFAANVRRLAPSVEVQVLNPGETVRIARHDR
jgi:L-ascorbate metabolism protein UlaG (beta-lactamase superfamily)